MAVPEGPRPRQAATSRAVGRAAPGLLGGTVPGLSPTRRGPQGALRAVEPEAGGATSGIILEIDTQFEMPVWTTASVPAWIVRDSWGPAPPSALNGTSLVRPGVTLGAGIWSMTMSAEAFVPSGVFLRGSFSYDTLPSLSLQTAPGNSIMGMGTGPRQYLSATVAGLRVTSGSVSLVLSPRDSSDVNSPAGVYIDKLQLTAVRLSD